MREIKYNLENIANTENFAMKPLRIQFLTAEAAPLIKVGGLGDVAGSLPHVIRELVAALDVRIFLPYYPALKKRSLNVKPVAAFEINHQAGPLLAQAFQGEISGTPCYFIDGEPVASSPLVYSGDNLLDGTKFTFFSLAAMELARILDWKPAILHAQDWHTAPAVYNLSLIRKNDPFFSQTRSLLTVHNLPYLGHGAEAALQAFGLPRAHLSPLPAWAEGLPLALGLLTADRINTVSQGYAAEILTPAFGAGLEEFLRTRREDISGILNGLDQETWDPEKDPDIPKKFGLETLTARIHNKIQLQEELGLDPDPEIPLLAMINRMDYQKGVDLVPAALRSISDLEWQAVILGTGDPALEEAARQLDLEFLRVKAILSYDSPLAHRIYAGSDLILIPSRYEPCGLTQMIGMRYGCVPLARATGGLKDTITDYHSDTTSKSTGFLFEEAESSALAMTMRRALGIYQDKRRWTGLQRRGMKQDFSWRKSAQAYFDLYLQLNSLNHHGNIKS